MKKLAAAVLTFRVAGMMKRGRGGAKLLAEFTSGLIAEALAARGLGEASLIADWPAIVGGANRGTGVRGQRRTGVGHSLHQCRP